MMTFSITRLSLPKTAITRNAARPSPMTSSSIARPILAASMCRRKSPIYALQVIRLGALGGALLRYSCHSASSTSGVHVLCFEGVLEGGKIEARGGTVFSDNIAANGVRRSKQSATMKRAHLRAGISFFVRRL
jgi:hypothetical protein